MPVVPVDPQSAFWRGHVRLGACSTAVCSVVGLVYALATASGPHRVAIVTIGVLALVSCPFVVSRPAMRLLTGPTREPWLLAWSASLILAVTVTALLDGGGRSPLTVLFAASLVFTASGFGRRGAIAMGASAIGGYLVTCLASSPGTWTMTLTACAMAIMAGTCALTAGRLRLSLERQEQLTEQLSRRASHDGLTGCLNHSAFVDHLESEVRRAHRAGRPLGLVTMDLDDFKRANDTHGHVAADELLAALGAALRESVRRFDVAGRLGGDEFAVVVPDAEPDEVAHLAERLRQRLQAVGARFQVGVSVGVAMLRDDETVRDLRERSDRALYQAKGNSRRHTSAATP